MSRLIEFFKARMWLLPSAIVLTSVGLAAFLLELDRRRPNEFSTSELDFVFGAGADGAREMLSTIAGSAITVAGVVFSITVVVLSLASSQYSPRVLRNFISDWKSQCVLGGLLGVFAYCIMVLRTIRSEGNDQFIPRFAVFGSVVLAFVLLALVIYFIHHIAVSIRASSIIRSVFEETEVAIDHICREQFRKDALSPHADPNPSDATPLLSQSTGYIRHIDFESIADCLKDYDLTLIFIKAPGEFIERGSPLALFTPMRKLEDKLQSRLLKEISISPIRTLEQDVGFGIRQLVDVALKGLSPGINDTTTAIVAIDHLGALLAHLASRQVDPQPVIVDGRKLVIPKGPSFESLLGDAFSQVRQYADKNPAVLLRQLNALRVIGSRTNSDSRLRAIEHEINQIRITCETTVSKHDQFAVLSEVEVIRSSLKMKTAATLEV